MACRARAFVGAEREREREEVAGGREKGRKVNDSGQGSLA